MQQILMAWSSFSTKSFAFFSSTLSTVLWQIFNSSILQRCSFTLQISKEMQIQSNNLFNSPKVFNLAIFQVHDVVHLEREIQMSE